MCLLSVVVSANVDLSRTTLAFPDRLRRETNFTYGLWSGSRTVAVGVQLRDGDGTRVDNEFGLEPADVVVVFLGGSHRPSVSVVAFDNDRNVTDYTSGAAFGFNLTFPTNAHYFLNVQVANVSIEPGETVVIQAFLPCAAGMRAMHRDDRGVNSHEFTCAACPKGEWARPGYYPGTKPHTFVRCRNEAVCPNNATQETGGFECADGYRSRLCSRCASNWFVNSHGDCECCSASGRNDAVTVVLSSGVVGIGIFVFIVYVLANQSVRPRSSLPPQHYRGRLVLKWAQRLWREFLTVASLCAALYALVVMRVLEVMQLAVMILLLILISTYMVFSRVLLFRRRRQQSHTYMPAAALPDEEQEMLNIGYQAWDSRSGSGLGSSSGSGLGSDVECKTDGFTPPEIDDGSSRGRRGAGDGDGVGEERAFGKREHATAVAKSFVVYLQTVSTVVSVYNVDMALALRQMGSVVAAANMRMNGLACAWDEFDFVGPYLATVVACPALMIAVVVAYCFHGWLLRLRLPPYQVPEAYIQELRLLRIRALRLVLIIAYFFIFPISSLSFDMFACIDEGNGSGATFLARAPWIRCGTTEHQQLLAVATTSLIVVFGGSSLVIWRVYALRNDSEAITIRALSFLTNGYRAGAGGYEVLVLVRRLVFALFVALLSYSPELLGGALMTTLMGAFLAHFVFWPLKSSLASWMEATGLVMAMFSLMAIVSMYHNSSSETSAIRASSVSTPSTTLKLLSLILILGNVALSIAFITVMVGPVFRDMVVTRSGRGRQPTRATIDRTPLVPDPDHIQ
ncbi:uncharacterized protein AMSG_08416 [Thecamonas trahens ATCC 50062]|uniref:TRP C-terminal domain-containing protein n=1 Tax=Thecamonas trahens ATCC 50062 TaxID=461836 RepID=A0A0L0DJF1_THETB|nr:hypothetical protein AMSG_08416 [Thecamonas trahens ATCC 50062]KNC52437.1 hypothetical protein AMSG_08416 [Thecamonas trahens ATCC 50062]|eukprot:XP_013755478.1 hypothetical protein AMSG_08416 [Thecamonas trahens ATCC 50062]